jgi:low affinity Fe/Cu permease
LNSFHNIFTFYFSDIVFNIVIVCAQFPQMIDFFEVYRLKYFINCAVIYAYCVFCPSYFLFGHRSDICQ